MCVLNDIVVVVISSRSCCGNLQESRWVSAVLRLIFLQRQQQRTREPQKHLRLAALALVLLILRRL